MPETKKALGKDRISAMFKMKLSLQEKEHNLSGYIWHGIENIMGAMATSPDKGQSKHICHGDKKCSVKHHTNAALRWIVAHIQRNYLKRRPRAITEVGHLWVFSNVRKRKCLVTKGKALLSQNNANWQFLKSEWLLPTLFISLNFDIGDWLDKPHLLYGKYLPKTDPLWPNYGPLLSLDFRGEKLIIRMEWVKHAR